MENQKHLFQLPDDIHYLNCAYMSPLLKSAEEAGIRGMIRKRNPASILPKDFFEDVEKLKTHISQLIGSGQQNIALMPSVSYGMASVFNNLPANNGRKAIALENEFPAGFYALQKWCKQHQKELQIIKAPTQENKGRFWNEAILNAIDEDIAVIMLSSVHWTDGTKFDLKAIGKKCKAHNVTFVVDGTQSVGAAPIDVVACQIDALICASYKWLMGPYAIGFGYFHERFFEGSPLEEAWINRTNAHQFNKLTEYTEEYALGASRYNIGEAGNFILVPMFKAAIEQLIAWGVENIQQYAEKLTIPLIQYLKESPYYIEEDAYRSKHLFGISLPENMDLEIFLKKLEEQKIYASIRGKSIRISAHLFNTEQDIDSLISVLKTVS